MTTDGDSIADLLLPRSRHVQFARPEPRRQEESPTTDEYTAFGRGRVGTRPQMMICFRKCSGEVVVFAYSMLTRIRSADLDRGFTLSFGDSEIRVEGENLLPLFHFIREHRAVEIAEADRATIFNSEDRAIVRTLSIITKK